MQPIFDVQNIADDRNLPINCAGIKGIRFPVTVTDEAVKQSHPSIAVFDMLVDLPAHQKGTHMSRFVEILNEAPVTLSSCRMPHLLNTIATRLEAQHAFLTASFVFFMEKTAPASGAKSLMDYDVSLSASLENQILSQKMTLQIPITSLCPCSKKIAQYGAHNQRSHVTMQLWYDAPISIVEIIHLVESEASCELYALLKRPDEKIVTERAYENPKFVEDLVRDIARKLQNFPGLTQFTLASENFESIHNHSAFAQIRWKRQP